MIDTADTVKKKRARSAAYPSINLENALDAIRDLHQQLGAGPYDRVSAAQGLGYDAVTGSSASKIAALVHYGLLQRITGGAYQETDLARRLINSIDDTELAKDLVQAFQTPKLFQQVYRDFAGRAVPEKLDIILIRNYRITEPVAKDVAKTFRQSAEFCGLLKNGYLSDESPLVLDQQVNGAEATEAPMGAEEEVRPIPDQHVHIKVPSPAQVRDEVILPAAGGITLTVPKTLAVRALTLGHGFQTVLDAIEEVVKKLPEDNV